MNKQPVIEAISFLYKGERIVIKVNRIGKFKVPVSEVVEGKVITRNKSLSAREVITHKIVRDCDPTLYVANGDKMRVYQGADSSYLPAAVDGIITKHDSLYTKKYPESKKKRSAFSFYSSDPLHRAGRQELDDSWNFFDDYDEEIF